MPRTTRLAAAALAAAAAAAAAFLPGACADGHDERQPWYYEPGFHRSSVGELSPQQLAVRASARHAWRGYVRSAWGRDDLMPLSESGEDWMRLGLTVLDSLDTLWVTSLDDELEEARSFVAAEFGPKLRKCGAVNTFEVAIRALGGLLGAYAATGDAIYATTARELGVRDAAAATALPLLLLRQSTPGRAPRYRRSLTLLLPPSSSWPRPSGPRAACPTAT
jgi:hypothetical protein